LEELLVWVQDDDLLPVVGQAVGHQRALSANGMGEAG